jgi:hypothetical protein
MVTLPTRGSGHSQRGGYWTPAFAGVTAGVVKIGRPGPVLGTTRSPPPSGEEVEVGGANRTTLAVIPAQAGIQ